MPEVHVGLLCNWFYVYVMGKWAWISARNMAPGQSGRRCVLPYDHDANHAVASGLGHEVPVPRSEVLRDRAREMPGAAAARRRVAAEDERRRAAKALSDWIAVSYGPTGPAAAEEFVERVGDYVLSRLQQKSHYGVVACPVNGGRCGLCARGGRCLHDGEPGVPLPAQNPDGHLRATGHGHEYGGDNPDGVAAVRAERVATMPDVLAYGHAWEPAADEDPCSGGRCPDREAHAEGAHDV